MPRAVPAVAAALAVLALAGCGAGTSRGPGRLPVVATTTQLGDLVRQVGGDAVDVTQLLKPNSDAHEYEPRPRDVLETHDARVVFVSGDGLDGWMGDVVEQSGTKARVLDLSRALRVTRPGPPDGAEGSRYDPHWWHDPRNAETAVREIAAALGAARPGARATFAANARRVLTTLRRLDAGIAACVARVPPAERKLVTDHDAFGYFAARYGIRVVGAVIPSQTTRAQSSAGDVAALSRLIRRERVVAVFPESSVSPKLAQAVARETGARVAPELYGDTLGAAGTPGATYVGMEQANADAMVRGFTGGRAGCRIPGL